VVTELPLPGVGTEVLLRADILDALRRVGRDEDERGDPLEVVPTDGELLDAIWGRLPAYRRRAVSRAAFDLVALRYLEEIATSGGW